MANGIPEDLIEKLERFDQKLTKMKSIRIIRDGSRRYNGNISTRQFNVDNEWNRDLSHQLSMQDLEHFEAQDLFVDVYLANCDRMLAEYEKVLVQENFQMLLLSFCFEISKQFENVIMKCQFNRYGTLQLDREYRKISGYLTYIAGWLTREKSLKLAQIVGLLNVETVEEAMEVWENSQPIRRLAISEVRKVLSLRIDFAEAAIKEVKD